MRKDRNSVERHRIRFVLRRDVCLRVVLFALIHLKTVRSWSQLMEIGQSV